MDNSSQLSPLTRAWALLAAVLSIFQSLCWGIMALLAIIGHGSCVLWSDDTFLVSMQHMYFQGRGECSDNPLENATFPTSSWVASIMNADSVLAWMCIWLSVNCVWFFTALSLLAAWKGARMTFTLPITTIWCVVTAVMMVLDLVACAMFGADYGKILLLSALYFMLGFFSAWPANNNRFDTDKLASSEYLAPPAVIMTLAARGFVLWFANLALLLYLINSLPAIHQHQKHVKEQEKRLAQEDFYGPPAPGYESYNQGFVMHEGVRSSSSPPRGYSMYPSANQRGLPRPDYQHAAPGVRQSRGHSQSRNPPRGASLKHTGF